MKNIKKSLGCYTAFSANLRKLDGLCNDRGSFYMKQIPLTQGQVALVDDDMMDRVSYFKWRILKKPRKDGGCTYYAATTWMLNNKPNIILLHRLIMGFPAAHIDHKDGDGLNNTGGNIRLCSCLQNQQNRRINNWSTSKYKGVYFEKRGGIFYSQIRINGKRTHLYCGKSEIEAAKAYNEAALKHFGEFARINNLNDQLTK